MGKTMLDIIEELKIVPVVKLDRAEDALPLAEALINGGLPTAEITFRTDAAEESIKRIAKEFPDMIVGAGTVINAQQAERAVEAGAKFIVSPGTSEEVIAFGRDKGILVIPGICTPTEVMKAISCGCEVVKLFPAAQYGGVATIKALSAPFPQVKFLPTGGLNAGNIKEYLGTPKVIACGGSWMVKDELIRGGRFDEIERLTREAVELVRDI